MWCVYIVTCADGSFYTGVTTDIERRIKEHNDTKKGNKGARYTRARQPVSLTYLEYLNDRSGACKREAAIKRLNRKQKLELISQQNTYQQLEN